MSICLLCPERHPVIVAAARVGNDVVCPHCLAIFHAEITFDPSRQARAEKGKPRRSKDDDDDDDDEEDEKPAKKAKPSKDKKTNNAKGEEEPPVKKKAKPAKAKKAPDDDDEDEEDEKPRKKGKAKKDDEDEDDEDDEDEEEKEEEAEPPIEWTPRKRQLNMCSHGLLVMMIGFYLLCAFTVFSALAIDYFEMVDDWRKDEWKDGPTWYIFYCFAVPMLYLATVAFMACMVMSLFVVPAKAEARGGLIATLVFGGLVFFLGLLLILSMTGVITADDASRQRNMTNLLVGGSLLCFAVCLLSAMGYQARLFVFMKMHLESSQPITNGAFALLVFTGLLILVTILSPMAKDNIGDWIGYVVALLADGLAGFGVYMLIVQAQLIQKLRERIRVYIRDE